MRGGAGLLQEVQRYLECCEKASATPGFLTANAGAYAEAMIEDLAVRTTQAESTIPAQLTTALNGRYAFEREIGRGGMAIVYLARAGRDHWRVAVKVLRPALARELGAQRFVREIRDDPL